MFIKKIFFFDNCILTTKLSEDEVLKRIKNNIQQRKPFSFSIFKDEYTKPYTGQIIGRSFKMTRNINTRNSMLPIINGQTSSFIGLTKVKIKMHPNLIKLLITFIWLGFFGLMCIKFIFMILYKSKFTSSDNLLISVLIPIVLFILMYLSLYLGFKIESKKSKKFLVDVLEAIDVK